MNVIENITMVDDVTLISLQNAPSDMKIVSKMFEMISAANIDIDMISQTSNIGSNLTNLLFTVSSEDFANVLVIAGKFRELDSNIKINVSSGNCKISVFGEGMRGKPGVVSKIFSALASVNTDVIMITTSEVDVSLLVVKSDVDTSVNAIKNAFK